MSYERLVEIWSREFDGNAPVLVPLVPLPPAPGRLLFVGLNPSFSAPAIARLLPDLPETPERYFAWSNRVNFDPELDKQLHTLAKEKYAYFRQFRKIAAELNLAWDHQDLFFWRETSQHAFRERVLDGGSTATLTAFGREQLAISTAIIDESKPVAIIVANALASDIYLAHSDLSWNSSRGCYVRLIGERHVPVFLSSMLTGQRALDRHSLKRLVWHIGRETGAIDNAGGSGLIATNDLREGHIPGANAAWNEVEEFARTFDGYAATGSFEACAAIANARRHDSVDDLRTCLFFEQRRWRHAGDFPDSESMDYIRSLVEQIREVVAGAPDA